MKVAGEETSEFVRKRIARGDRIRFLQDFYGGQFVELTPRWQFWRKMRLRLDAREVALLKSEIKDRPRPQ